MKISRGANGDINSISILELFNSVNIPEYYKNFVRVDLTDKRRWCWIKLILRNLLFSAAFKKAQEQSSVNNSIAVNSKMILEISGQARPNLA